MDTFPSEIRGYTPVCSCGRGAYGQVWRVVDDVGCYRALKIVSKSMLGNEWKHEFSGLKLYQTKITSHPNLIQIFHVEDCGSFFYYTMECADNLSSQQNYIPATLEKYIEKYILEPAYIADIFDRLLDAVDALHEMHIIHRDIKPENIIFVNDIPKLSDIGLATSLSMSLSVAGTQSFVPPEILSGEVKITKENGYEVDIYALGKTLYCTFSGRPVIDFPMIPPKILKTAEARVFNKTVKMVCHPSSVMRLKTTDEFRNALSGNTGFSFCLRSFLVFLGKIFVAPYLLLAIIIRNVLLRNLIFLILVVGAGWNGYSLFIRIKHEQMLNTLASSGILSMKEEKEYVELKNKKNLSDQEKMQLKLITDKIDYQINSVSTPKGSGTNDSLTEIRQHKLIYREKFSDWDNWKLLTKKNLYLTPKGIVFGACCNIDIILDKVKLPDEYEINFTLEVPDNMPKLRFIVYVPNSVDYSDGRARHVPPENRNPAAFHWNIGCGGTISSACSRQMAGAGYTLSDEMNPHNDFLYPGTHRFTIIKVGNYVKIYCDEKILYSPLLFGWKGGKFRIVSPDENTCGRATISELSIYDISRKTWGSNEFYEPGPPKKNHMVSTVGKEEDSFFPYNSSMLQLSSNDWKIFNPAAIRIDRNGMQFTDELMFVLKHKLPSDFCLKFHFDSNGIILVKFLKEMPNTDDILDAFWKYPGLTVIPGSFVMAKYQLSPTVFCDVANFLPYLGPHIGDANEMVIRKIGGAVVLHNRYFILGAEDMAEGYLAFYIYGCERIPIKNLEIKEEPSFDLSLFGKTYFDSIILSAPVMKDNRQISQSLIYKGELSPNSLEHLLPGLVHYSLVFKQTINSHLNSLQPMSDKELNYHMNGFLRNNWSCRENITEKNYSSVLHEGAEILVKNIGIPFQSGIKILKQYYSYPTSK